MEQGPLRLVLVVRPSGLQEGDQRWDYGRPGGQALPTEGLGQRSLLGMEVPDERLGRHGGLLMITVVAWGHGVVLHLSRLMRHMPSLGRVQDALP
jgi:hypothetical protein